ncbi:MAG: hypothetical protein WCP19_02555 [Chloroflexota bacterium]
MSEGMRVAMEIGFNILYLIVVWTMNVIMSRQLPSVPEKNKVDADLFRWAFILLALGDTGHVGFRVIAYMMGGLEQNNFLVGIGALATAVTVTFFYAVLLFIWKNHFKKTFSWFEYFLFGSAVIRLLVMAFPQNDWGSTVPPVVWGPFRNLFLVIQGLGIVYLYLRDSIIVKDRLFRWMAYCIFFSFLFYAPVILFAREYPLLGMLMIPKTVMYVLVQFLAYFGLWKQKQI